MKIEHYEKNGRQIRIPIPENYKDCLTLVKSDMYRSTGRVESLLSIIMKVMKPFNHTLLFWFRLSQYRGWLWPICRFMYARVSRRYQVDIPASTKIGYGLYIGHGISIVIHGGTIIGNNVNISQFLNIGTNHNTPAIICDNVYIAPHVCIVDDVIIGSNSTIGAGAVVTKDVPENATVAGVPAKVLNYDMCAKYVTNRWPVQDIQNKDEAS